MCSPWNVPGIQTAIKHGCIRFTTSPRFSSSYVCRTWSVPPLLGPLGPRLQLYHSFRTSGDSAGVLRGTWCQMWNPQTAARGRGLVWVLLASSCFFTNGNCPCPLSKVAFSLTFLGPFPLTLHRSVRAQPHIASWCSPPKRGSNLQQTCCSIIKGGG